MKRLLYLLVFASYLAFGQTNNVLIKEEPAPQTSQNQTPQAKPKTTPKSSKACPNKDAIKWYLVSHNLATYTVLGIIPSNSVSGYCDVILQGDNNSKFFIRIRHDLAYVIAGSVVNTSTNKVVIPNMSKFKTISPKQ